eukprot:TRINITY_DN7787_c0_g1_i2.p1 TRINITY_DN7787_c0_g1~~TRINITY_DN7787_c0_g1_i2.p1  ORF type:complete len:141 (+),score=10.14 TRINITY_DN7787_c0_g1_i2:29-424(+)
MGDQCLESLAIYCPALRRLDVSAVPLISDAGVAALCGLQDKRPGCSKIEQLMLAYCARLGDDSLASIQHLSQLRRLDMSGCPLLTSSGISGWFENQSNPFLSELRIQWCPRVKDDVVVSLMALRPSVKVFY